MPDDPPLLTRRGMGRRFPGVVALDGVDFTLRAGEIQAAPLADGRLSSGWSRIVVGLLLLVFILLQRFLASRKPAA